MKKRLGAIRTPPASWRENYAPTQPTFPTGGIRGKPRGDAAILSVLCDDTWGTWQMVADRLGLSRRAAFQALRRARMRGLIEHAWNRGYRRLRRSP